MIPLTAYAITFIISISTPSHKHLISFLSDAIYNCCSIQHQKKRMKIKQRNICQLIPYQWENLCIYKISIVYGWHFTSLLLCAIVCWRQSRLLWNPKCKRCLPFRWHLCKHLCNERQLAIISTLVPNTTASNRIAHQVRTQQDAHQMWWKIRWPFYIGSIPLLICNLCVCFLPTINNTVHWMSASAAHGNEMMEQTRWIDMIFH